MQEKYNNYNLDYTSKISYQCGMSLLKKLRIEKGLTQTQLAELVGTHQPQITRWETNNRDLPKDWAEKLAPHLGATAADLLFTGEPDASEPIEVSDLARGHSEGRISNMEIFQEAYEEAQEIRAHAKESELERNDLPEFAAMVHSIYILKMAKLKGD
ncbi:helix-turn-helix domain-containing protein [Roseibium album]|uniref:helix-turn-helix domain-containing protein n=1 Tax=Roseibium album TaxID=311410 RepID=UPI003BB1B473